MFTDKVEVDIRAGKGGDGLISFRRERFVEKGGPDGGDGGRGGNVVLLADHNFNTLADFRRRRQLYAEDGGAGGNAKRHGKNGQDLVVPVPVGTVASVNDVKVIDLTEPGQTAIIAKGGKGGFGNAHFISSTRQAPRQAELGEKGEVKDVVLELKLLADVGLVGLPNAGKSTLLSVVSNARPEIADYPFTTLTPHLGVVDVDDTSFLMADIPGLIEGASQGKGLGDEFLRHIERTSVLLHLIDVTRGKLQEDFTTIQKELGNYKVDLTGKPQIVVLTKSDAVAAPDLKKAVSALKKLTKSKVFAISAVAKKEVLPLLREVVKVVAAAKAAPVEPESADIPVLTLADDPGAWWVESNGKLVIKGTQLEGFAKRTDFRNSEAVVRLRDILRRKGVFRELQRQGAKPGDKIKIAGKNLIF